MIPKDAKGLERHIVTVLTAIMTALLCWIGYTTQQTAVAVAQLSIQIEGIAANAHRLDRFDDRIRELERE